MYDIKRIRKWVNLINLDRDEKRDSNGMHYSVRSSSIHVTIKQIIELQIVS